MKKYLVLGAALSAMSFGSAYAGELTVGIAQEGFAYDGSGVDNISVSTSGLVIHGDTNLGSSNFVIGAETFISMQGDADFDGLDGTWDADLWTFKTTIGYDFKLLEDKLKLTPVIGYQLGSGKLEVFNYDINGFIGGLRADYAIDEHLSINAGLLVGMSTVDFDDANDLDSDSYDAVSASLSFGVGYRF